MRNSKEECVIVPSVCNAPELHMREDVPSAPLSPYAIHKLTGEYLCQVFTTLFGLETVSLRYFNFLGPRQDPSSQYASVIPLFLTALLENRQSVVFGDGAQTRDFTYIEDVVQANLLAAEAYDTVGQVMNIGCGQRIALNDVLRVAGEVLGVAASALHQDPRPGDIHDSVADISRARQLIGYEPHISFREGLTRTLAALR